MLVIQGPDKKSLWLYIRAKRVLAYPHVITRRVLAGSTWQPVRMCRRLVRANKALKHNSGIRALAITAPSWCQFSTLPLVHVRKLYRITNIHDCAYRLNVHVLFPSVRAYLKGNWTVLPGYLNGTRNALERYRNGSNVTFTVPLPYLCPLFFDIYCIHGSDLAFYCVYVRISNATPSCNQVFGQTPSLVTIWGGRFTDYVIMSYATLWTCAPKFIIVTVCGIKYHF